MKEMEFHISIFGNNMQQIIVVEKDIEPTPCYVTINFLINVCLLHLCSY
jgi:hypothetical protein